MVYIFLDESGQFYKHSDNDYFVIGSFLVLDPRHTKKRFLSWRQSKYPKKMSAQSEIKIAHSHTHIELKKKTIQFLSTLNIKVRYSYLNVKNIPLEYRNGKKFHDGLLYSYVVAETLAMYFPISAKQIFIYCDQRKLKGLTKSEFITILRTRLSPLAPQNSQIFIEMIDSTTDVNIQIADWIAGSLAAYHNRKPLGNEFCEYLKSSVVESKEFFKDYWTEKQKTQQ
jgi:hypothetical protein